jgi:hypothetical protein
MHGGGGGSNFATVINDVCRFNRVVGSPVSRHARHLEFRIPKCVDGLTLLPFLQGSREVAQGLVVIYCLLELRPDPPNVT